MHPLQTQYRPCAAAQQLRMKRRAIKANAQALAQSGAPSPHDSVSLALRVSQRIAAARAAESARRLLGPSKAADGEDRAPLFVDPYAELLATWPVGGSTVSEPRAATPLISPVSEVPPEPSAAQAQAHDIVATAHLDRLLLNATALSAVNRITQGDYLQVVLLGDGMDTRPFRLPLPPGSVIFLVAPADVHAAAEAALASARAADIAEAVAAEAAEAAGRGGRDTVRRRGPRPPSGCVLRRVALDLQAGDVSVLPSALEAVGFRFDRLSVWALQGLAGLELGEQEVLSLLVEAAHCAAYHSLLLGELPAMGARQVHNTLADCGLLSAPLAFGTPDTSYGRWRSEWGPPFDPETPQRWLFAAQQIRLSTAQMDTYTAHTAAAAELDEDFFDNFS